MDKVLIVDGNNLLFQMFYGIPKKVYNKSGETIHATIGFISAILKMLKLVSAKYCIVVFDEDSSLEKQELYPSYKQNRFQDWESLKADEIPFNEEDKIIKCLTYLNIKVLKSKAMEADDLIASLTYLYQQDQEVYICSYDSDFYQLINEHVQIIRYKGEKTVIFNQSGFMNQFGFLPIKYVFYKSLVGDKADNINGFSGIGKVKASGIVKQFASFQDALNANENQIGKKVYEVLHQEKEKYAINEKMISLYDHDLINYHIEEFLFDTQKVLQSHSMILAINQIFD